MDPGRTRRTGMDWEMRQLGDFALSPNARQAAGGLPGRRRVVADRDRRSSTPSAASTILYAGALPAPASRRTSACARSTASPTTGRSTTRRSSRTTRRTSAMMGVAGLAGRSRLSAEGAAAAARAARRARRDAWRAASIALGWHWWPSDSAIATRELRAVARPASTSVPASPAARRARRRSTDVTYWPAAMRRGVRAPHAAAACARSRVGANGMADGVVYYDADGVERRQRAEIVVLACNGIGTPRLLLNSTLAAAFPTASRIAAAWSART